MASLEGIVRELLMREGLVGGSQVRVPFLFGSVKSTGVKPDGLRYGSLGFKGFVRMYVNPSAVSVKTFGAKKVTVEEVEMGRVAYFWVSDDGYAYDWFELTFNGVTGNINFRSPGGRLKYYAWMKLRDLTAEPQVLENGEFNYGYCVMKLLSIPFQVVFIGYFPEVMEVREEAGSPFVRAYSFRFVVMDSVPSLKEITESVSGNILGSLLGAVLFGKETLEGF